MGDILGWSHETSDIPERGLGVERSATAAERAAIVAELDLVSCDRLDVRYTVKPIAGGGYRVTGDLAAELAQRCIVTLDPVPAKVESQIAVEYRPEGTGQQGDDEEGEIAALTAAEIEPIAHGRLDVGRVVFEQLAAALDPYPRKEGAAFEPPPEAPPGASESGPFAALARLKAPEK